MIATAAFAFISPTMRLAAAPYYRNAVETG
jgi:hypothetical protein